MRTSLAVAATLLCVALTPAQQPELDRLAQDLETVFDRPAGTTIGREQRDRLAKLLEPFADRDLGRLGYARALLQYLDRDYPAAVATLDGFFAESREVANTEHATMLGRVFLNALANEARAAAPDPQKIVRWSRHATRLYRDTAMLVRLAQTLMPRVPDAPAFRTALAEGVFAADLPVAQKDAFLRSLYSEPGAAAAPAVSPRAAAAEAGPKVGDEIAGFAAEKVVGGDGTWDLAALRGKVVVLDFFATWCPPCRAGVPGLVALQKENAEDLRVVAVTRWHGRGMEFKDGDELPHGGKGVDGMDHDRELAVDEAFARVFALNYPMVVTKQDVHEHFGVRGIPTAFVLDKQGRLVGRVVGNSEAAHAQLLAWIAKARG